MMREADVDGVERVDACHAFRGVFATKISPSDKQKAASRRECQRRRQAELEALAAEERQEREQARELAAHRRLIQAKNTWLERKGFRRAAGGGMCRCSADVRRAVVRMVRGSCDRVMFFGLVWCSCPGVATPPPD